jgi:16S rRNA (guanine1516-N2)-methyltransferase
VVTIHPEFQIVTIGEKKCLVTTQAPERIVVTIDFLSGASGHRFLYGQEGRNSLLGRACGLHLYGACDVLDLTAGLGGDGFVLASLGCTVTLVERNFLLWQLLEDGLTRLRTAAEERGDENLISIASRLALMHADGVDLVKSPDLQSVGSSVVYLDPMYPARKKSALVKAEMQALSALLGKEDDAAELLAPALSIASKRVVVKRMLKAEYLSGLKPHHSLYGKTTRYDIYMP